MDPTSAGPPARDRRAFLSYFSALGLGGTLLPGVLWSRLQSGAEISLESIRCAEEIAGLSFSEAQREQMLYDLREQSATYQAIRSVTLDNAVPPALHFDPWSPGLLPAGPARPATPIAGRAGQLHARGEPPSLPSSAAEIAFLPAHTLGKLIRARQLSSEELTRLYLDRIARLDPIVQAVITLTEERAIGQARQADAEIARGIDRGPLHGVPWGAKDTLAVAGAPTTWGSPLFREQLFDRDATVVERLDRAGAVLLGKLSVGELAWGDVWFGGTTRNPWDPEQGASGSSAGSAAATAAGLVGFSLGTETLGSISSPADRTGTTGARPTFGRVPTRGAMTLAWSMDKIGPLCRSALDCALVLAAILGPEGPGDVPRGLDAALEEVAIPELRIGYLVSAFDDLLTRRTRTADLDFLAWVGELGIEPIPIELPDFPYEELTIILRAEAAAAFDAITRSGQVDAMVRQEREAWPNVFRAARTIPAVEYINANRIRTLAMLAWQELFQQIDILITPTHARHQLAASNLTGNPAIILPHGFGPEGTPHSITLLGGLGQEMRLLAFANLFQQATDFHRQHPARFREGSQQAPRS